MFIIPNSIGLWLIRLVFDTIKVGRFIVDQKGRNVPFDILVYPAHDRKKRVQPILPISMSGLKVPSLIIVEFEYTNSRYIEINHKVLPYQDYWRLIISPGLFKRLETAICLGGNLNPLYRPFIFLHQIAFFENGEWHTAGW